MAVNEKDLKGNARCFTRRARKIELEEGDVKAYFQFSLIRRILRNWFRSIELRNEEDKVRDAIELLLAGTPEEDVPEEMYHTYKTVRSILRTDGEFDLWTPDFDRKKAELVVKLASRKRYLPEMIERNFFEMDFETWETKVIKSQEALRNLYRYIDEEKRTDMIWPDKPYYVNLFGMMVEIFPHAIHIDERSRTIEVIKYSAGKPELAFKSRNEDAGINTSLRLFALWMLGKSFIPDGNGWRVKASIYYLRKPNDTKKWEPGYFGLPGGQSPIRTLEEGGVYADTFSKTEALFEPQVEAFRVGRECDGKDCDGCDLKSVCHFNSPPLQTEIPRKRKTITDLELSGSQEEAIYFREGILRVNAGAGAGKTMVVALRISIMLSEGVLPKDILLITFTDAAAAEMKERIAMYNEDLGVEVDLSELGCMTFNAFGNEIIKTEYDKLGFLGIPRLIDDIEKKDIVLKLLSDHHITGIDYRNILMDLPNAKGGLAVVCKGFEIIKTRRFSSYDEDEFKSAMASAGYSNWIKGTKAYGQMLKLFEVYDEELRNRGLIEFADQERLVFDLLDIDPYYFDKLAYKHITVDEFQDSATCSSTSL